MKNKRNYNNEEVLQLLQKGDESAFNFIFSKYHKTIYFNVLKILKDPWSSEDIVQEVFIALWEKRKTINPQRDIGNWLFTVSFNKSINLIQKKLPIRYNPEDFVDIAYSTETIEKEIREIKYEMLEAAIKGLSPQKSKVLDICKFQGRTYAEAATELRISQHTVKEHLCGALKKLRQLSYSLS